VEEQTGTTGVQSLHRPVCSNFYLSAPPIAELKSVPYLKKIALIFTHDKSYFSYKYAFDGLWKVYRNLEFGVCFPAQQAELF
jgi:hypothetical protein